MRTLSELPTYGNAAQGDSAGYGKGNRHRFREPKYTLAHRGYQPVLCPTRYQTITV